MIIEKILKQLTPERVKREVKRVYQIKLPPKLQKWVKRYEEVGERDKFIWQWLYRMFQAVQLPIVPQKFQKSLLETKVLITMFVVQLDDVADKKQRWILLNELLKIPFSQKYIEFTHLKSSDKKYLIFTKKLWNYIMRIIQRYPFYKELKEIFNYDLNQVLNAIKYSYLINKYPPVINKTECWQYTPYNMVSFIYSGLDFMCSPKIDFQKFGKLREIIWEAQKMARIGNWVSTWEREIDENDFTSGVFVYGVDSGILTIDELKSKNKVEIIQKIKKAKIEDKLLREWERSYHKIGKLAKEIKEKRLVKNFLSSLEKLIILHLTSKGYK